MNDNLSTPPQPVMLVLQNGLADVNLILAGLGELPAKLSFNLIKVVEEQYRRQSEPKSETSAPEEPK